jgi:NNP family nitrate/nitrite transporter-like MFS transporter
MKGDKKMSTWLKKWEPEDPKFWEETGKKIAWRTLIITTATLVLSFATWFMMSAIVVRLPQIGFQFTPSQLFWLTAMPGLAGGTLRIVHTFLIPLYGTRHVITIATFLKLFPVIGIGLAVMNPDTPFWVFMVLAFAAGFGGGDFSSYMPSTSMFFPKRLQGTALGIQAGIGNFGVSLTQFVTPWIIGFAAFGTLVGGPQVLTRGGNSTDVWLQNASFVYIPFLIIMGVVAWIYLRSVPVTAKFSEQLDIFKNKHTWFCTITYIMTFGSFSGFSATFPLLIATLYGVFPDAPDPLKFAFLGPLVGSVIRVVMGPLTDRFGGAIFTTLTGVVLTASVLTLAATGLLTPTSVEQFPYFVAVMLIIFLFAGIGNAATFRQYPIIFAHNPRQGAGVIGWTAAVAAYGPFIWSVLIGAAIARTGNPVPFFYGIAVFYVFATAINWWYYNRPSAEKPS